MIKLCIVQPLIPLYRVPLFEQLCTRKELEVEIWADLGIKISSLKGISSHKSIALTHAPQTVVSGSIWQPLIIKLLKCDYDVIVINDNIRSVLLYPLLFFGRVPIVLWGHGYGTRHPELGGILRKVIYRSASAIVTYGPATRQKLIESGIDSNKVFSAPNTIDQKPVNNAKKYWDSKEKLAKFRDSNQISENGLMLYLARVEPEKLPLLAIQALANLNEGNNRVKLAVIGAGSMLDEMKSLSRELCMEDSVIFLGELFDQFQIAPWALCSSFLIHPGTLGLSILHAFGYGLPVVTSDNMRIQMPEIECLEHDRNGLIYKHNDIDSLTAACERIFTDPGFRDSLSKAALEVVDENGSRSLEEWQHGFLEAIKYATAVPLMRNKKA